MCPDLDLLEKLALGLLGAADAAPLEDHLETCPDCLRTLIERDPTDELVEALRQAPQTAERCAALQDDIDRLLPRLMKLWGNAAGSGDPRQTGSGGTRRNAEGERGRGGDRCRG